MLEVNVPPAYSLTELSREYFASLELALRTGKELGLRLYPLATYPLAIETQIRDEFRYQIQARTVGYERFTPIQACRMVVGPRRESSRKPVTARRRPTICR